MSIISKIWVGWSYQRFGMSFGTQLTFWQCWFEPPTPSAKKIDIRKKNFGLFSSFFGSKENRLKSAKKEGKNFWTFFSRPFMTIIPAIWDVFWDQTDLLTILVRPPNTLNQKNRDPKKIIFGPIFTFSGRPYWGSQTNSKENAHKWKKKKWKKF